MPVLLLANGCFAGAGPTAGWSSRDGFLLGWEASGAVVDESGSRERAGPIVSVGESFRSGHTAVSDASVGVVAIGLGNGNNAFAIFTFGLASSAGEVDPTAAVSVGDAASGGGSCDTHLTGASAALGVRWIDSALEVFIAPKVFTSVACARLKD